MNPNTSSSSAMHARWRTRAVTCCALACSVFWAGNVDAQTENVVVDGYPAWETAWAQFYQQWQYWYVERQYPREEAFRNALLASGLANTVTNFLGYAEGDDLINAFWDVFDERHDNGAGGIYVIPYTEDDQEYSALLKRYLFFETSPGVGFTTAGLLYGIHGWLHSHENDLTDAATTNLLTTQNATLDRVAEYVAGVSNAVGTISNEYETDSTGSNDLPSAETPDDLTVERSVDTSSLEEAVKQTFDGLDNLIPTGSSTVPEITIREAYRGEDAIKVRLDLHDIAIATRVCKACWAILLAVGVLGIVRSEWDYWTTLGGSAT